MNNRSSNYHILIFTLWLDLYTHLLWLCCTSSSSISSPAGIINARSNGKSGSASTNPSTSNSDFRSFSTPPNMPTIPSASKISNWAICSALMYPIYYLCCDRGQCTFKSRSSSCNLNGFCLLLFQTFLELSKSVALTWSNQNCAEGHRLWPTQIFMMKKITNK